MSTNKDQRAILQKKDQLLGKIYVKIYKIQFYGSKVS